MKESAKIYYKETLKLCTPGFLLMLLGYASMMWLDANGFDGSASVLTYSFPYNIQGLLSILAIPTGFLAVLVGVLAAMAEAKEEVARE